MIYSHVPDVMNMQFMLNIFRKQFMNIRVSMMTVRDNENNRNSSFLLIGTVDKNRFTLFQVTEICKYCLIKPLSNHFSI